MKLNLPSIFQEEQDLEKMPTAVKLRRETHDLLAACHQKSLQPPFSRSHGSLAWGTVI